MARKVVIEALLVHESISEQPEKIKRDILEELSEECQMIPWFERIEKVEVVDIEKGIEDME